MRWMALSLVLFACGSSSTSNPGTRTEDPATPSTSEPGTGTEDPASTSAAVAPYPYGSLSDAEHADVCGHTAEPPSEDTCSADTDCRICHDGSRCGIPANVETIARRGAECRMQDGAECESAAVRCCDGHCRVVSH